MFLARRQKLMTLIQDRLASLGKCGTDEVGSSVREPDLVNNSHINLQDVRNMHCGPGWFWKRQTKVMNHHLHHPRVNRSHLVHNEYTTHSKYLPST